MAETCAWLRDDLQLPLFDGTLAGRHETGGMVISSATSMPDGTVVIGSYDNRLYFFTPDGNRENGLSIGMSISNYGTPMKYDGMDLLQPIDISPDESGNFKDVEGQYRLQSWELPLIFRVGVSVTALKNSHNELTLAVNALHPNNNSESLNIGGEYQLALPGANQFFLRAGYRGLYLDSSEYGWTFGGGVNLALLNNRKIKLDYAYKTIGLLGNFSMFTVGATF